MTELPNTSPFWSVTHSQPLPSANIPTNYLTAHSSLPLPSTPNPNTTTNDTDDRFHSIIDDFRLSLDRTSEPLTVALLAVYACIFVVAVAGNALVLIVVIKNKGMRTVTNCFLLNLSIADLLGKCRVFVWCDVVVY